MKRTPMYFIQKSAEQHAEARRWYSNFPRTYGQPRLEKSPGAWTDEDVIINAGLSDYCLDTDGSRTIVQEEQELRRYRPDMVDYKIMLELRLVLVKGKPGKWAT